MTIGFTESAYTVHEGNDTAIICVAILEGDSPNGVTINMITMDDTASC